MPVHFNNAGAGLMPAAVTRVVTDYLAEETDRGSYETEQRHADTLEREVYAALGRVIDAPDDDIALFDSATRAWSSVVPHIPFAAGDRVWVTPYEYAGNLILWTELRRRLGLRVEVVPVLPDGDLDLDWMSTRIGDDVAFVSVPHVPSGCGIVTPVEEIGKILAPWRCYYGVDGCQSVGQLPVSAQEIGCDLLVGAGRKFLRGPRGTGFAAVSPRLREAVALPFHDLHIADMTGADTYEVRTTSARRLEYAERSTAGIMGLEAAARHHLSRTDDGPGPVSEAVREAIAGLPGTRLLDPGTRHASIVTFVHDRVPARDVRAALHTAGVNVWVAQGSHTPLYMDAAGVEEAVRVSPHYYNSMVEVETFARVLRDVLR
ncbi:MULTISPECIES: aminotransferase class V-fold PLP-dependent enzyme [Streptomyces]|uniref:aminotransferase class V-fold PLP-dependent enzyme n=1 Tax=Streptomyces TaxID=1883 RepID=UPI001E616C2F|nr:MULTISPECIES: aminotransferase class V-fold PLP-dependent enzyme [Streptomyces]UFQ17171.1 aminotransferase class V-fold PLP-dependent enzyme [Streptomyces huasconensis]WCL86771.1 aminotransferase class V-fold PLP-dependent enzyme [Streptomyces sp. JCM 35825]